MRKSKKIISLILCALMLMVFVPVDAAKSAPNVACDSIIELEDGLLSKGTTLSVQKDKNVSGGKYLLCSRSGNNDDPDGAEPELTFMLSVPKSATYYIWLRYGADSKASDSLYISFDDESMKPASQVSMLTEKGGFYWQMMKKQSLGEGDHLLKITPRENGMRLDALYITFDSKYKPDELVLAEQKAAEEKAIADAAVLEIAKTGAYFDKKAPVFSDWNNGGLVVEAENTLLKEDLGGSVVNDAENAYRGKAVELLIGLKDAPDVSEGGSIEFNFKAAEAGNYKMWLRYSAATNGNDSVYISYNGSLYTSSHDSSTTYTGSTGSYV